MFLSMAFLWEALLLNFLPDFLCLIFLFPLQPFLMLFIEILEDHTELKFHAVKNAADLVERLTSEILGFKHSLLSALHKFTNNANVGCLEAVSSTNGEFEFVDALEQIRVEIEVAFFGLFLLGTHFIKVDEYGELILEDFCTIGNCILRVTEPSV